MTIEIFSTPQPIQEGSGDIVATTREEGGVKSGPPPVEEVIDLLEGTPNSTRGDRKRPTIIKFPIDLGDSDMPHVMQFKVFWRWEAKSLVDMKKKKQETEDKMGVAKLLSSAIDGSGGINPLVGRAAKILGVDGNLASTMMSDPLAAKQQLEETVKSSQKELVSINSSINRGETKQNLSQNDRAAATSARNIQTAQRGINAIGGAAVVAGVNVVTVGVATSVDGVAGTSINETAFDAGSYATGVITDALITTPQYDQMVSIYLPVCTKINNEDAFSYEDESFKMLNGAIESIAGEKSDAAAQGLDVLGSLAADAMGAGAEKNLIRGTLLNPRLEKMFKQKDFRTFSFSWEMYPRSEDESQAIHDIIETFRYHAHPSIDDNGRGEKSDVEVMFRVPAEFEVRFLSTNPKAGVSGFVENPYIPKIGRCALTNISVDYTPQSVFSTLKNNAPVGVIFNLTFTEMGLLTRDSVDIGF
jgi:hypothetical protein